MLAGSITTDELWLTRRANLQANINARVQIADLDIGILAPFVESPELAVVVAFREEVKVHLWRADI